MDVINELGGRGLPPRGTPTLVLRLALISVTSKFASLSSCPVDVTVKGAITHLLVQDPGDVDDMTSGKAAFFKRGLISLPRVQAELVPLSVRSLTRR